MIAALLTALPCRVAALLAGVAGFAMALSGAVVWDWFVDDPRVAARARAGYVVIAEQAALEGKLAETQRQAVAAEAARNRFAANLAVTQAANAGQSEQMELEIADYERKLVAAGRSCRLDDADIDWLRKP